MSGWSRGASARPPGLFAGFLRIRSTPNPITSGSWILRTGELLRPAACASSSGVVAAQRLDLDRFVRSVVDAGADPVDEGDHEPLVVDGAERRGEHLLGLEEMVQVRPGVVLAGVAVALLVDGDVCP